MHAFINTIYKKYVHDFPVPLFLNNEEVVKYFEDAGYTNITVNVDYDIITGWLPDYGEVESVTIDGKRKINS